MPVRVVQAVDGGSRLQAVWAVRSVVTVVGVGRMMRALKDDSGGWGGSGQQPRAIIMVVMGGLDRSIQAPAGSNDKRRRLEKK
ncbi:hypothetical protein ACLOJK_034784 [Asimina triloba]